jgi:methyl-accepting chemotaxis protein
VVHVYADRMPDQVSRTARRNCFVIAPIGEEASPTRIRSDKVMKYLIKPVVESMGFEAARGDQINKVGYITSEVIDRIVNDDLVIADLTDLNPNVFYELAVRHAIRKPFVQLIDHAQNLPFDVHGMRTIAVDLDPEALDRAKQQLRESIEWLDNNMDRVVTPISYALTTQDLRGSSSTETAILTQVSQTLPQITEALQELKAAIQADAPNDGWDDGDAEAFDRLRMLVRTLTVRGDVTTEDLRPLLAKPATSPRFANWVEALVQLAAQHER